MKKQKLLSLIMTATLLASSLAPGTLVNAQASSKDAKEITLEKNSSILSNKKTAPKLLSKNKKVSIIVEIDEESIVDEFLDDKKEDLDAYLSSKKASKIQDDISSKIEKVSQSVLQEIKGSTLEYQYDTVFTGFTIKTTYNNLEKIRSIKGVKHAYISDEYAKPQSTTPKPNMVTSSDMIYAGTANKDYHVAGDGMVIAVLDTGIDYNHAAFNESRLSGINVACTKSSITGKLRTLELDSEKLFRARYDTSFDINDVYQNLKVPYAFDYADNDLNPIPPKTEDHGTHVAGTIAGNCDEFKGIAYNAQVMSFKVFSDAGGGCTDASLIASLDDAVKLGVDVINMSLGSSCGFVTDGNSALQQAYDSVAAAGISLEVAAGNEAGSASGSNYGDYNLTQNPDEATVGNPSTLSAALSVAAMENTHLNYQNHLSQLDKDGKEALYTYSDSSQDSANPWSGLPAGEYKYVDCGFGYTKELNKVKSLLKGNIALISRGDITFEEKVKNAYDAGAAAAIIYNNDAGMISMQIENYYIPAVSILQEDGKKLLANIDKSTKYGIISFDPEKKAQLENPLSGSMSSFTSIGPTPTLELKPEITAPGGNIYSSYYVDDDGSSVSGLMSGTSMATPHLAGATAIIRQYYQKKYPSMSKVELTKFIHSMEMSTSNPVIQKVEPTDGTESAGTIYYSPRVQGSGLINIAAALSSDAYLAVTGQERPKAELSYNQTGTYRFETSIVNKGSTEKTYKLSGIVQAEDFTEDSYGYTYAAQKEIDLTGKAATIQFTGTTLSEANELTVPANGKATVTVDITLDKTSKLFKSLNKAYSNGFYVEGFVFATPVKGETVELSLPFLGFYGDYPNLPIFDDSISDYFRGKAYPVFEKGCCLNGFDSEFPLGVNYSKFGLTGKYDYSLSKTYTSVNSEGKITSNVIPYTYLKVNVSELTYTYRNSKGTVIKRNSYTNIPKSFLSETGILPAEAFLEGESLDDLPIFTGYDKDGKLLPNGTYTLEIEAKSAMGGKTQKKKMSFKVDNTAPTVNAYSIENSKYVYVTIKAKDNASVQSFDLFYGQEAVAAGYSALWKKANDGKLVLKLKKSTLPSDFNASDLRISVYDHALNSTTEAVTDKYNFDAPKIKQAAVSKNGGIILSWKKVPKAKGYMIYRSTSKNGTYKCVKTTSKLSYRDTKSLHRGKTYYYKVVAYTKEAGIIEKGAYSSIKKVKFH